MYASKILMRFPTSLARSGHLGPGAVGSCVIVLCLALAPRSAPAVESAYEPGFDPGVGFNLISWSNAGSSGAGDWENAVQSVYDAGFGEVSVCPVRYIDPATGAIAVTSTQGPELAHVAAGIVRAKSLGMTVTVNPFVEPENFTQWRGFWNPAPGSGKAAQFWCDYQQYIADVAVMAQAGGADFMNVGTELKAIVQNSGNNANWNAVINAADQRFSGPLGYAANWDNFKNANLTSAIWEHPAIDYLGVDAYFPAATEAEANASGAYPDQAFIGLVRDNWNTILDGDILPFAEARKGGEGMPVVFSEYGVLPFNCGVVQHNAVETGVVDQAEQIMGFEALLGAMDHRRADDDVLAVHVWQWGMSGSDGSLWNMETTLPTDQPNNVPAAEFLADFVTNPLPTPGDTNGDRIVDDSDLANLIAQFGGAPGDQSADFDGNNFVGLEDFAIMRENFGFGVIVTSQSAKGPATPTPEPAGILLLLAGLPVLLKLRQGRS